MFCARWEQVGILIVYVIRRQLQPPVMVRGWRGSGIVGFGRVFGG